MHWTTCIYIYIYIYIFFTGQQETEQCLLPLVQKVNMLYRTVVFVDKTIQPWAVQDAAY